MGSSGDARCGGGDVQMNTPQRKTGTLYFFAGRAGAGKSTVARQFSLERQAILFCEDQWIARLFDGATSLQEYLERRQRVRHLLAEWVPQILTTGHSVVFDFGANTIKDRAWVRSIFAKAGAEHELHYILADESLCRQRVQDRNRTKPEGIYWGDVSDELLDTVNRYFQPPTRDEGFTIVEHLAGE
jgi:predicted kinase